MNHKKITWDSIRAEVLADPKVKAEYDALESEFDLARKVIARKDCKWFESTRFCRASRNKTARTCTS